MNAAATLALAIVGVIIGIVVIKRSERPKPPTCPNVTGDWKKSDDNSPFKISTAPSSDPTKLCLISIESKAGVVIPGWVSKADPKGLVWFFDAKNPTVATRGELSADGKRITFGPSGAFYIRT